VPAYQPLGTGSAHEGKHRGGAHRPFRTQHTGLPTTPAVRQGSGPRKRQKA